MIGLDWIKREFQKVSDKEPEIFQSPGRVNLIGDHTDYNMGLALPAAIDKYVQMGIQFNGTGTCHIYALDIAQTYSFKLSSLEINKNDIWSNYFIGVTSLMRQAGAQFTGFDCVFSSDIPIGAGLSSSAAICCCLAYALNKMSNAGLSDRELVLLAQKTEHDFVGLQCGTMDQTASLMGKRGQVLKIDFQENSVDYSPVELGSFSLVLVNSRVKHSLASSGYNDRKDDCDQAIELISQHYRHVDSVRAVSKDMLVEFAEELGYLAKRVEFVIEENARVDEGCKALANSDQESFGKLMYASHKGLRSKYEVSCEEIDFLVDFTKDLDYVVGSRMTGGGFGGCTINLVKTDRLEEFSGQVVEAYTAAFRKRPKIIPVNIADGTVQLTNMGNLKPSIT